MAEPMIESPRAERAESGFVARGLDAASARFVVSFLGIAAVLFCLYYFPYGESGISEAWIGAYLASYARAVGLVLGWFEPAVTVSQNVISGRFAMSIVKSCDAMEANMLFSAAVLALPRGGWRKAVALVGGLAALVAANVVRLCSLYYVGVYFFRWFEFAHIDLWPLLMIAFAVFDFMICARWLMPRASEGPPARGLVDAV